MVACWIAAISSSGDHILPAQTGGLFGPLLLLIAESFSAFLVTLEANETLVNGKVLYMHVIYRQYTRPDYPHGGDS